jgi:hypothetical protein
VTTSLRRVAVGVSPRLYADALARALEGTGCRVVRVDEDPAAEDLEDCVVVIVSGPAGPEPAVGRVVIHLPESGEVGPGSVHTTAGEEQFGFSAIDEVIDLVTGITARQTQ